jgi:hypothetical protein
VQVCHVLLQQNSELHLAYGRLGRGKETGESGTAQAKSRGPAQTDPCQAHFIDLPATFDCGSAAEPQQLHNPTFLAALLTTIR